MKILEPNSGKRMFVTLFKGDSLRHGMYYENEEMLLEILDSYLEGIREEDIDARFFEIEWRTYSSNGVHMLNNCVHRARLIETGLTWEGQDEITKSIDAKQSRGERVSEGEYHRQQKEYESLFESEDIMKLIGDCPYADELNRVFRKIMDWNVDIERSLAFPIILEEYDGKEYVKEKLKVLEQNWSK